MTVRLTFKFFYTAGVQINNKTDTPVINFPLAQNVYGFFLLKPAVNIGTKKSELFYNVIKSQNTMNTREYVLSSPTFAYIYSIVKKKVNASMNDLWLVVTER